jgi:tetratricopeptide (TPR) repeat protein
MKTLDALLESYKADPEHAPASQTMEEGARALQKEGDKQSARKILEVVFASKIADHQLEASTFLGLADIRLENGDVAGAMELLRRMTLTIGGGWDNLDSAAALLMKHDHAAEATEFLEKLAKAVPWNSDYRVRLAEAQLKANKDADGARATLANIASSGDVAYSTRVMAAKDLAGRSAGDLHSAELNLLATGKASTADVAHPFYYDARLLAAQSATGTDKVQILRAALEDWPHRDAARMELFKAAVSVKQYQLAVSDLDELLQGGVLDVRRTTDTAGEEEEDLSQEAQDSEAQWSLGKLPQNERASLATQLGQAFDGLGMYDEALRYYRTAYKLESSEAKKKSLQLHVNTLRAVINRATANAARKPTVHSTLEQDHVVRPRLVAKAPPPVAPAVAPARRSR